MTLISLIATVVTAMLASNRSSYVSADKSNVMLIKSTPSQVWSQRVAEEYFYSHVNQYSLLLLKLLAIQKSESRIIYVCTYYTMFEMPSVPKCYRLSAHKGHQL